MDGIIVNVKLHYMHGCVRCDTSDGEHALTSEIQILLDYLIPQHVVSTSCCALLLWVPRTSLAITLPLPENTKIHNNNKSSLVKNTVFIA